MNKKINILWTDDEIDLLKPHIIFLEQKGYHMETASNGQDAIELVKKKNYDIIFLDENMPGLSGLDTLKSIKAINSSTPVVMITKNEEENIMDEAIGSKIADYLIKPVNPKQVLLSIKKILDNCRLVNEKTTHDYQAEFGKLGMDINYANSFTDWSNIFKRLIYWDLELENTANENMYEVLFMQQKDANNAFAKFIQNNYQNWVLGHGEDRPLISPNIFKDRIFPLIEKGNKVFFILIDNLRFDQWKALEKLIQGQFSIEREEIYCSILPTATQYSRNAIFAGLMPLDISNLHKEYWKFDDEDSGKNLFEEELFQAQLKRLGKKIDFKYHKIKNITDGKNLVNSFNEIVHKELNIIIYNFIDNLSHARTEIEMIKELANDERAYRSITQSWFSHSELSSLLKLISEIKATVVLTSDHGSIRVDDPVKIIGDRETSTNLRYKTGKSLNYKAKELIAFTHPEDIRLPKSNLSSSFVFAKNNDFLAYPNNFNYYVRHFKNTFQHGGVSLEEMFIPLIVLKTKA